jgi:hypothetical protein
VKKMLDADARMGVGSHGQIQGIGFHWEMWAMGSGGAENMDDLRNTVDIEYVMKDGRLYDGMTLDEVYPQQRSLERRRPVETDPTATSAGIRR